MIKCLMDVSIPEDDKCAKCCICCEEKVACEYTCRRTNEWKPKEDVMKNCIECL